VRRLVPALGQQSTFRVRIDLVFVLPLFGFKKGTFSKCRVFVAGARKSKKGSVPPLPPNRMRRGVLSPGDESPAERSFTACGNDDDEEENRPQDQLRGQIQQVALGRFRIMKTEPQCDATAFASSRSEPSPPAAISRPADDAASRSRTDEGEPRHEETHIFNVRASWVRAGTHSLSERNLTSQAFADLLADLPCPDSPVRPHTDFFP